MFSKKTTGTEQKDAARVAVVFKVAMASHTFSVHPGLYAVFPEGLFGLFQKLVDVPGEDGPRAIVIREDQIPPHITPVVFRRSTFSETLPPPAPKPQLLTRADIMKAHHLTAEQFDSALLLGFPRSVSSRSTMRDGIVTATEALWHEKHIEQWVARQSVMRLHAEMV